ncbi:hypothetical protein JCM10049v2_004752 [Rhodotorula toruloides]
MSPSTESSSNSDAGAGGGEQRLPKYRLDALPAELLKFIVILVKEQDERLAQPLFQRHAPPLSDGIRALSRVSRILRAAVIPYLRQIVTPDQLAHPLFQYGRVPPPMLQALKLLDCSRINRENAVPATANLERLPSLDSLRVNCYTWDLALGKTRFISPESEYDDDGEPIPPPPAPKPLDRLQAQMAQEALELAKARFSAVHIEQIDTPAHLKRHFRTFVDVGALRELSLSPWTQFYDRSKAALLAPPQECLHLVTLRLSGDGKSGISEPVQPDFLIHLPSVEELSIDCQSPRIARVIERMAPNVRTLRLTCEKWGKIPPDLPHLANLHIHATDYHVHALSLFAKCPYTSATWTDPRCLMVFGPETNLAEILPLDLFSPTLRCLRVEASHSGTIASSFESYRALCTTRGIAYEYDVGTRAVDFLVNSGDEELSSQASSVREVLRWAQDRVDWLEQLGDKGGLHKMARRVQDLKTWQVLDRA